MIAELRPWIVEQQAKIAETRFVVLQDGAAKIKELTYNAAAAQVAMQAAGLTQGYDRALLSGYWPSEDVLPQALRLPSLAKG